MKLKQGLVAQPIGIGQESREFRGLPGSAQPLVPQLATCPEHGFGIAAAESVKQHAPVIEFAQADRPVVDISDLALQHKRARESAK